MKNIKFVLVLFLLLLTLQLSAGDLQYDPALKLDFRCTSTWGMDIANMRTGFETVINWLSVQFTPKGFKTFETEQTGEPGEPYMYLTASGLDMTILNYSNNYGNTNAFGFNYMTMGNIAAKLVVNPFWIGVIMQGNPQKQIWNYDNFISDRAFIGSRTTYRALQDGGIGTDYFANPDPSTNSYWMLKYRDLFQAMYPTTGRVLIGYDHELINVISKIGSRGSWTSTTNANQYAFGIDLLVKPIQGLKIAIDGYGSTYSDATGDPMFSARATYDIPLIGQINLQPFVAFDDQIRTNGMDMEFAGGINIPWPGDGYKVDPIYILEGGTPNVKLTGAPTAANPARSRFTKADTFGGLTLGASCYLPASGSAAKTIMDLSIFESQGDEGFLLDTGLVLSAQLYNFLGTPEYGIAVYLDQEILDDMFRPFIAVRYQEYDQAAYPAAVDNIDGQVGIHYIAIPNATIGIEYESGNLLATPLPLGFAYVFISLNY